MRERWTMDDGQEMSKKSRKEISKDHTHYTHTEADRQREKERYRKRERHREGETSACCWMIS